jgi:hypothetical protein
MTTTVMNYRNIKMRYFNYNNVFAFVRSFYKRIKIRFFCDRNNSIQHMCA